VKILSVLIDGKERYSFSPCNTKSISFDLSRGEKLIEVISREPEGDIPLAAYLVSYDGESYNGKWRFSSERRIESTVILEGRQKIGFVVSLTKNAEQVVTGARITVCYRPPSILGRAAQWWNIFQVWNWQLSALPNPIQAFVLCLGAILGLIGYRLYLYWRPPAEPKIMKQRPETQEIVLSTPTPEPTRWNQDDLEMVAISKDGAVRLPDQTLLPASPSRFVRELIKTGLVTPTENARLALAAIDDLTRDSQRRAQEVGDSLPFPASPILTAIRPGTTTLQWNSVPGAQGYQVRIAYPPDREDGKVVWEAVVGTSTQVTLPPGVLQPGQVYLWQVETSVEGRSRVSPEAGFWVLDIDSLRMVVAAEQRYGRSALVRASVYEACGLYEEALSQIERLAKINPASSRAQTMLDQLRHQLGKE
jgi:hypothetical protein